MNNPRSRESRQEEVRQERRRRDNGTIDGSLNLKMAVPPEIQQRLSEQGREWRWANDVGNRIHQLTQLDDWDKVEGVAPRDVIIDKAKGLTCKAYLLSKPKDFSEQDRREKESQRRSAEKDMLAGAVPNAATGQSSRPSNLYLPSDERGGKGPSINKIERGNQVI